MALRSLKYMCNIATLLLSIPLSVRMAPAQATATPTAAPTPNFNNVTDPLNGMRTLVDVTDMIVVDPGYSSPNTTVGYDVLTTSNGQVSAESKTTPATLECSESSALEPFPQMTLTARLFNLPNDVLVVAYPNGTVSNNSSCVATQSTVFTI